MRWEDPNFGVTMYDFAEDPGTTAGEKQHVWLMIAGKRDGSVSHQVADAVTVAARGHGLPILVRDEYVPGGKVSHKVIATRIGNPQVTPSWRE